MWYNTLEMSDYMYNIVFVCYGNICRSPMAEMIFKDLIFKNNKRYMFTCTSRSTSMEEIGNGMYPKAIDILNDNNIVIEKHKAQQLKKDDYNNYDLIIGFENRNINDILRIIGDDSMNKVHLLGDYLDGREIDDPWYTDDFITAYNDIYNCVIAMYNKLVEEEHNEI